MRIVLVAGTPGTDTAQATEKVLRWARATHPTEGNKWVITKKFEEVLLEVATATDPALSDFRVLLEQPIPRLRQLWRDTVDALRTHITESVEGDSVDLVLVPIHLSWFHQRTREYISVLDAAHLSSALQNSIAQIVCLIDDIHDVYARLRAPHKLYDRQTNALESARAARGHAFLRHTNLLDWRAREVMTAEALAAQLDCGLSVLATKHQASVAYHILRGGRQVYLSHPISELRRIERDPTTSELAASMKEYMWELQQLLARDMALLQPTCIDEFRIDLTARPPRLSRRFYPHSAYERDTMFQLTPLGDDVIYDDQDSSYDSLSEDMNVAYNLGVFARDSISSQVSSRDLQLVSQSDALVVFRPRYRGNLSGGVREEISYHDEVTRHVRVDPWRRIILVDSKDDEDVYMTRQLLEAMYSEVETGGWQFDVGEPSSDPSSDLDSISEETRRAVDSVAASQSTADLEAVIQLVLHDLGRRPDWTVRSARSIAPLQRRGTFVEGEEQKERVLGEMMARLTPLAELAEYSGRRVVRIDDRSPSQLAAELVGHLEE